MKSFDQMWEDLAPYLTCEKGLDEGYADGKYTKFFAKYCKQIDGIDISEEFQSKAKETLKDCDNVKLHIMDARKTIFPDKHFDVILNTSFHEFDLSGDVFTMDFDLKTDMLLEMIRLSDTICFAEIAPENISGELYKVFNPVEDHSLRTAKSNELIHKVLIENGYEMLIEDRAVDEIYFNSKEEFIAEMVDWWSNVRVPRGEEDKKQMENEIARILETENMLTDLCFHDIFRYTVYKKKEN